MQPSIDTCNHDESFWSQQGIDDRLLIIHRLFCDAIETYFATHGVKGNAEAAANQSKALEVIEFMHLNSIACKNLWKEHKPPPRYIYGLHSVLLPFYVLEGALAHAPSFFFFFLSF